MEHKKNKINYKGEIIETIYNYEIIDKLVKRKGLGRALKYLNYESTRGKHYLGSLFKYLNKFSKPLKVLEVGCSAGHITEYLQKQNLVKEIYAFDVDKLMVETLEEKKIFLNLDKVKRVDAFTSQEAKTLPYEDNCFDLVVVVAVVEHLPFYDRHLFVDEYYRVLKNGGKIAFLDTPNRHFPLEWHSTGLFFISKMSPELAYIYVRIFLRKKYKNVTFQEFVRPGVGWRNSSYYELLPKSNHFVIEDITEEAGYLRKNNFLRFLSWIFKCPQAFFDWNLNVVFYKANTYEKK